MSATLEPTGHVKPSGSGADLYARLRRVLDTVDGALITVSCLMLFVLMCLVVADVSRRYLMNAPIEWSYEVINNYLMPGLFFFAASHTLKAHAHVAVDILHNYLKQRARYVLAAIGTILSVPFFAVCTWVGWSKAVEEFQANAVSTTGLPVPTWTVTILFPIGFGLLTLRLALTAVGYTASAMTNQRWEMLPPISGAEGE